LLSGKTVVFKDTVCVAGVPLLLGTNAFENYIRMPTIQRIQGGVQS
jgi:Asp-tRNA(Asn)/Glu-tRNA(Gln) amidotransferase A subunit family amidase